MLQADVRLVRGVRIVFIRSGEVDSTTTSYRGSGREMWGEENKHFSGRLCNIHKVKHIIT